MSKAIFSALTGRLTTVLRKGARAFRHARNGNIAMIFAISIVPVMVAGAAGIDLARTLAVRTKMYAAVDAAALAVASRYSAAPMTDAEADALADQYFQANYALDTSFGTPGAAQATVDGTARSVTVTSDTRVPTTLMNIAGIQYVNLSASSNVVWGQTKIWVGLALDTTGSMAQGDATGTKIAALKTAVAGTNGLLDKLEDAAATAGDVKLALVPFARQVNVFDVSSSGAATWLDWTKWDESHGSCTINGVTMTGNAYDTKTECQNATGGTCSAGSSYTTQAACNGAGICSVSGNTTQTACQSAGTCSAGSNFTTQNSCQNAGTCNIAGNYSQNSCQNARAYMCSLPGYTTQTSCQNAGTCNIPNKTTQSQCVNAVASYTCVINGNTYTDANHDTQAECTAPVNGICSRSQYTTQTACQNANRTWYIGSWTAVNGVWTAATWSRQYGTWTSGPGTWTSATWTALPGVWTSYGGVWTASHTGWNGCVADRGLDAGPANSGGTVSATTNGFDTSNETPATSAQSKFPVKSGTCATNIKPLGYDWSTLKTTVNNLGTSGATNQPIGLAWAWHSLTNTDPMNSGTLPSNTTRYIIIVSDGENTADRWYGNGSDHSSSVDDRMGLVCTAAKADNVIIYALFINIAGTAGNAASMKNCATGGEFGGRYYEVSATGSIGTALDAIAQQITNLRVAQ